MVPQRLPITVYECSYASMTVLSWLVLVGALGPLRAAADDPVPLHIGGTFPMEAGSGGWAGGQVSISGILSITASPVKI